MDPYPDLSPPAQTPGTIERLRHALQCCAAVGMDCQEAHLVLDRVSGLPLVEGVNATVRQQVSAVLTQIAGRLAGATAIATSEDEDSELVWLINHVTELLRAACDQAEARAAKNSSSALQLILHRMDGIPTSRIARLLGVTEQELESHRLDGRAIGDSARLRTIAELVSILTRHGQPEDADGWFYSRPLALDGFSPLETLDQGPSNARTSLRRLLRLERPLSAAMSCGTRADGSYQWAKWPSQLEEMQ